MAADKNGDGRLDAEELRALLKKHRGTFTDKEVEDLGEMFYAAKAGGSVSYDRFIHALDVKLGDEGEVGLDMGNHFKRVVRVQSHAIDATPSTRCCRRDVVDRAGLRARNILWASANVV